MRAAGSVDTVDVSFDVGGVGVGSWRAWSAWQDRHDDLRQERQEAAFSLAEYLADVEGPPAQQPAMVERYRLARAAVQDHLTDRDGASEE